MPVADGKLTEQELEKIASWLKAKTGNTICPVCSADEWMIAEHLLQGMIYRPNTGLFVGGTVYPEVVIICTGCGYSRHFAAVPILGKNLNASPPPQTAEDEKKPVAAPVETKVEQANG